MKQELQQIGFTKKAHGINGEIKLKVAEEYLEDILASQVVFIELNGHAVPYFVESVRFTNVLLLKLEDVNNRDEASKLSASPLLLRVSDLLPEEEKAFFAKDHLQYAYLIGYRLMDVQKALIGTIEEIQEFPQQEMAVVHYKGKSLLLPLHPQLIKNIDESKKEILLDLPDGLLSL